MESKGVRVYFWKKNLVRALFLEELFENQLVVIETAFTASRKTPGIFNIYEKL